MVARAITSAGPKPCIADPQAYEDLHWQDNVPQACAAISIISALMKSAQNNPAKAA